jgi:hypothetical protein
MDTHMKDMTTDTVTVTATDTGMEIKSLFLKDNRRKEVETSTLTVLCYTFLATYSTQ